ncbi:MAG: LysR substrate-binding domain-containing protein [Pikeienuella sp.]
MRELLKQIGSLHHLTAFEAAARHGSFTRAAEELNVSQPAISQSIRRLEAAIGVPLFQRGHRSITLTDAGELLAHDVVEGFQRILSTVKHLNRLGETDHVTLSVSTAFANYWMIPRLQAFHDRHPLVDLRLQTTDKELDLAQEGISLGVRRGHGEWRGYESALIAPERLVVVASPAWLSGHGPVADPAALSRLPLIHLEEPYRARPSWTDWFKAHGVAYRDTGGGLRLNDYALVLQATMAGEGAAMGYHHVLGNLLEQGLLTRVGTWEHMTGVSYHLVWSSRTPLSANAVEVRDWVLERAASNLAAR